jgi:3',5'-cyclic AMP phosphodiesterase CpdA
MFTRRELLQATPVLLAALSAPAVAVAEPSSSPPAAEPPEIGRSSRTATPDAAIATLELGTRSSLRLLQFTDNHFFARVKDGLARTEDDQATEHDWRELVRIFRPDAVITTGDLWHNNPGGRGAATLAHAVKQLEQLDIPWAFCWGNHDHLDDYAAGHAALEAARGSLYRGGASHGDYRIDVRRGPDRNVAARLWLLNSNQYGLTAWQLDWLRAARGRLAEAKAPAVPALAFFHIPLLEQKTLHRPETTPGLCFEKVCNEREMGQAAPVLAGDDRLRACFCGHDHLNDYAVRAQELDLVYGRATGYSGYGGDKVRKGAKLIELDLATGDYQQTTVFADGSRWRPT